jgi:LemA protein
MRALEWSLTFLSFPLLIVFLFSTCSGQYNRIVTSDEEIENAWSQIETVLQRRNDLIPNLVNTVKGYAAHEQKIFIEVAEATTLAEKVQAQEGLGAVLGRLLAIAENYPELKANQNFLALQDELAGTENRISVERRRYNEAVRNYNVVIRRFPTLVVARLAGYDKKDVYFEASEEAKQLPQVTFE